MSLTPNERVLSVDETLRLARVFVGAGVNKIRLTGGEPTVRRDLPEIISALDELRPLGLQQIAMTSNGIALPRMLPTLVLNGLDRLNLSLDTLERDKFTRLTRRDGLHRVLDAIDLALELGARDGDCTPTRDGRSTAVHPAPAARRWPERTIPCASLPRRHLAAQGQLRADGGDER